MGGFILNLIEKSLKKESERIYLELYELYLNKIEVNTPFCALVFERIQKKYIGYKEQILSYVVKQIPINLNIAFDDKYVFYDDRENRYLLQLVRNKKEKELEEKFKDIEKNIKKLAVDIVDRYGDSVFDIDIFDIFEQVFVDYFGDVDMCSSKYKYITEKVVLEIEKLLKNTKKE